MPVIADGFESISRHTLLVSNGSPTTQFVKGTPYSKSTNCLNPRLVVNPNIDPKSITFHPLTTEDSFDIYDLEVVVPSDVKTPSEILARFRHPTMSGSSSGRPTYKAQRTTKNHMFGKKNMNVIINRNETWDVNDACPIILAAGEKQTGKGYCPIFLCDDEPARPLTLTATHHSVLSGMLKGGSITMAPWCGSFDPSHRPHRNTTAYHFFSLDITNAAPVNGEVQPRLYSGGGHFLWDSDSQGRPDLLATLYCTGYEQRSAPQYGDIVVAELRLDVPPIVDGSAPSHDPTWRRLFKNRHASIYISKRGLDLCFSGESVQLLVPNPIPNKRYFLTPGQAQEIVIIAMTMSIFAIEHEGLEKKWEWLNHREDIESNAEKENRNADTSKIEERYLPQSSRLYNHLGRRNIDAHRIGTDSSGNVTVEETAKTMPFHNEPQSPKTFDPEVAPFLFQDFGEASTMLVARSNIDNCKSNGTTEFDIIESNMNSI